MDAEERDICDFLKSWQGQFVAGREICKRAGGKWRFREDPNWAMPILSSMIEKGMIEGDALGHYRLAPDHKKDKKKKWWVSPQMKKILSESEKLGGVVSIEDTEDAG
jgi:hypothetical protein